jgi:hypothetical protein
MEGCGPCNATRPEWTKMAHTLQKQYAKNKDLVIIDINKDLLPFVKNVGSVNGFPTMKYITNNGNTVENYEDSSIKNKDRSVDSFINWIESKMLKGKIVSTTLLGDQHVHKELTKPHSQVKTKTIRQYRQTKRLQKQVKKQQTMVNKNKNKLNKNKGTRKRRIINH